MCLFIRFCHHRDFFLSLDLDNIDNGSNNDIDHLEEIHKLDYFYFLFKFTLSYILLDCIDINTIDYLCRVA